MRSGINLNVVLAIVAFGVIAIAAESSSSTGVQSTALGRLQSTSPGVAQAGHINVAGSAIIGGDLSVTGSLLSSNQVTASGAFPGSCAVSGTNTSNAPNSYGVCGMNTATTGAHAGVYGEDASGNGIGVRGLATYSSGLPSYGGYFESLSTVGTGVYATAKGTAVYAKSTGTTAYGVRAEGSIGVSGQGIYQGVIGTTTNVNTQGVAGWSQNGVGVQGAIGSVTLGAPNGTALAGCVLGNNQYALYAQTPQSTSWAGFFSGKVEVQGPLKIADGTQNSNYVLVSDGLGNARWADPFSVTTSNWTRFPNVVPNNPMYPNNHLHTVVGFHTSNPATWLHVDDQAMTTNVGAAKITFGNGAGSSDTIGLNVTGTAYAGKGSERGVYATAGLNYSANSGTSAGTLAQSSGFDASGSNVGVTGIAAATILSNIANDRTSQCLGGSFTANPANIAIGQSVGTYWIGGALGQVNGPVNTNLPVGGAYAGIIGLDNNTGSATSYAGYFKGNVFATGAVTWASDARLKQNVQPLQGSVALLEKLRGVTFNWNQMGHALANGSDETQIGFIAQEVRQVLPSLVSGNDETLMGVNYGGFAPLLVEAVKEQQSNIRQLQEENRNLRKKIELLEEAVTQIKASLDKPSNR